MTISLNSSEAEIFVRGGKVILSRTDIITFSISACSVMNINGRTCGVVNGAPTNVQTVRPVSSNIVSHSRLIRSVISVLVGRIDPSGIAVPEIITSVPDRIARIRGETIMGTMDSVNIHGICLVRTPGTTTVNYSLSVADPRNVLVTSINDNATSVTILSLNKVSISGYVGSTNYTVSRRVIGCVEGRRGLVVNAGVTRTYGGTINYMGVPGRPGLFEIGNESTMDNLPGFVSINCTRVGPMVRSVTLGVVETVGSILRRAPPRLINSVCASNVVLANNLTGLAKFTELLDRSAGLGMEIRGTTTSYIVGNYNGTVRCVSRPRGVRPKTIGPLVRTFWLWFWAFCPRVLPSTSFLWRNVIGSRGVVWRLSCPISMPCFSFSSFSRGGSPLGTFARGRIFRRSTLEKLCRLAVILHFYFVIRCSFGGWLCFFFNCLSTIFGFNVTGMGLIFDKFLRGVGRFFLFVHFIGRGKRNAVANCKGFYQYF